MRACIVPECGKKHRARGFCKAHYQRHMHGGDTSGPIKHHCAPGTVCSRPSCGRPYYAAGLCGAHYQRSITGKSLDAPVRESKTYACTVCGRARTGYGEGMCLKCSTKAWRIANPEYKQSARSKEIEFWRRRCAAHGITRETWEGMFASQRGMCASCGDSITIQSANTDHCHRTGVVRGLLCRACNVAAGLLEDSPERARKMAAYLDSHRQLRLLRA